MVGSDIRRVQVIDSHTGGEPTRVVIDGGPDLGRGSMVERRERFRAEHDEFRSAVVMEPRGSDVIVGAMLCEPVDKSCAAGVIFFNNASVLGMCGHGTIGLMATLAYMGRVEPGDHVIETPVGLVSARLHESGEVTIENVPSYRLTAGVEVEVEGHGKVTGDVAWGGNWFFLVSDHDQNIAIDNVDDLTAFTCRIREALSRHKVTGADDAEIDHIELFSPCSNPGINSKNFVLCPGRAYDRSPCGTGTSAKLACLHADGKLKEGEVWRQESIVGSVFEASFRLEGDKLYPSIKGSAFVTAEATLILDARDPLCMGIR